MFDFNREIYVCKCATEVPAGASDQPAMRFGRGGVADLDRLSRQYHTDEVLTMMRARLARGEHWLLGEAGGEIVTYSFLVADPIFSYDYLPGCVFSLSSNAAYCYGAWTPDHLRGHGYRRRAMLEELRVVAAWGKRWLTYVFIKPHLPGVTRNLARLGIALVPLWKVTYTRERTLAATRLAGDDDTAVPRFPVSA
jgi:hypothetical protein